MKIPYIPEVDKEAMYGLFMAKDQNGYATFGRAFHSYLEGNCSHIYNSMGECLFCRDFDPTALGLGENVRWVPTGEWTVKQFPSGVTHRYVQVKCSCGSGIYDYIRLHNLTSGKSSGCERCRVRKRKWKQMRENPKYKGSQKIVFIKGRSL